MRLVAAMAVAAAMLSGPAMQTDSIVEPSLVSDSISAIELDSMDVLADTSDNDYHVQILQPRTPPMESGPSSAVYIALQKLGERVDKQVYRLKTLAAPTVERIELGQLAFKMTMSYDFDLSKKRVTATVKLDRLIDIDH